MGYGLPGNSGSRRAALTLAMCCALVHTAARAEDVAATLSVAWQSFWQQSGFPRAVSKWTKPIVVRFSGESAARHREHALQQLQAAAEVAGISISEVAAGDTTANLEVEFVGGLNPLPPNAPCVTNSSWRNFEIQRGKVRANEQSAYRCMLHEAMHVMGIPGHPMGNTVLTYFARSDRLTETDRLLLKTIYSSEVEPGTSPFAVMSLLAARLVSAASETARDDARRTADAFLMRMVREMEAFGDGTGEAPAIILRSGKATGAGLAQGRTAIQYFLGLAYMNGHIVERDRNKALEWLGKAAAASHGGAQRLLKAVGVVPP